ncbi:MAG TPA: hypothetical protein GYA08_19915 [Chloroflexi bacterium]|nr:hypothetical protein [Chloroflexota bacterium]
MFDGVISIAPYALLSVVAATTAVLFAVAVGIGVRGKHTLVGAAAMALLSLWFAGIAITAGPNPSIRRTDVAGALRWLAFITSVLWLLWIVGYTKTMVNLRR